MAKKGQTPWNKGLTKENDARVRKYSEINSIVKTGKPTKKRKYSFDPADWWFECIGCQKVQIYKSRDSYVNAARKVEKKGEYKCCICSADYKPSKQTIDKAERALFLESLSPDERKQEISRVLSIAQKNRWKNVSDEDRQKRNNQISKTKLEMNPDKKKEVYLIISAKNKEKMLDDTGNFVFRPGYNKDTIPYIEHVLNNQYNTKFIHAESDGGEFKVYDVEFQRFYYADAYCPQLSLWIEFDEPGKFNNGKLPEKHIIREERIKKIIPNIIIKRIYFDRNEHKN